MIKQSLNSTWQVRENGKTEWMTATVPGCIHMDLMKAGLIPDPFVGKNERQVGWVALRDWNYRCLFTPDPALLGMDRFFLVCEGLDTLAEVRLNGQEIGRAENMFRPYRWEVTQILQPGENELAISFKSPVMYARQHNRSRRMPEGGALLRGGPHLRKAQSHFGWDWGPILPTVGIWRGITLEGRRSARLDNVRLRQEHGQDNVVLSARVVCQTWDQAPLQLRLAVTGPDGVLAASRVQVLQDGQALGSGQEPEPGLHKDSTGLVTGSLEVRIDQPQLWWPNGYGDQPLYGVEVTLETEKQIVDQQSCQVGFRTLHLRRQADARGRSFTFAINGVPIFCKGSNWIPSDSLPARVTPEKLEHLLVSAAAANQNMLRVWGGGYYEDEYFYELCDRLGLLVWQDFMFACAFYPWDEDPFLENVKSEVVAVTRRLRHHACLALWCGNNEIEMLGSQAGWHRGERADLAEAYRRFFYQQLPEWIGEEDLDHPYWPSSPASTEPFKEPGRESVGDAHLWDVFHMFRPFSYYRKQNHRFVSEFGFPALPALKTIASFATPDQWYLNSPVMRHHQRSPGGNDKILLYLLERFRLPKSFSDLVYLSQIVQAEGVRTGAEHWRRNPDRTGGALYWQLNDCWPVISWSSIDYFGRWKALHYASRRFFAPVLISIDDDSFCMEVYITNDLPIPWTGRLIWSLETLGGTPVDQRQQEVLVAPLASNALVTLDFTRTLEGRNPAEYVFITELWQGEERLGLRTALFVPEKLAALVRPKITIAVEKQDSRAVATLTSNTLARFVELGLEGAAIQPVFSDNYFDLPSGRPYQVSFSIPEGFSLDKVRNTLKVRSLADASPTHSNAYGAIIRRLALIRALGRVAAGLMR